MRHVNDHAASERNHEETYVSVTVGTSLSTWMEVEIMFTVSVSEAKDTQIQTDRDTNGE